MADRNAPVEEKSRGGLGMREFVALLAALMAASALAIDSMLPALPPIGEALGVLENNRRQLVITAYLIGFGTAQIVYGPISDRFGRKWLLVGSLGFFGAFSVLAAVAESFDLLLAARLLQGVAAASTRVVVLAVVRDRYEGSAMARVMSMTMIVFVIVPVLAPAFGQAVLAFGTWRHIFLLLGFYGAALMLWTWLRLPETLRLENRRALSTSNLGQAALETVRIRQSIGNTIAQTLTMGALFSFVNSVQQIVFDVFEQPQMIGLIFACIAAPMAVSAYANSKLVMRFGSRRLLLLALSAFTAMAVIHLISALLLGETIWMFVILLSLTMGSFGLIGSNLGALAMQPLGHIAGTASSIQGMITTIGGALIGLLVGQQFNGTTLPLLAGFAFCGGAALAVAFLANRRPCRDSHDPLEVEVQETTSRPG